MTELYLHAAIEQSPLPTLIFGPDGRYLLANAAWKELWGSGEEAEISNVLTNERLHALGLTPHLVEAMNDGKVSTPLLFQEQVRRGHGGGERRWLRALIHSVRDEAGDLLQTALILEDFTERKALEEQLAHQAFHDNLTGLPNRALFTDRLGHALSRAGREIGLGGARDRAGMVALLFMDLDDFKRINDSLGHEAGDSLLKKVAGRVQDCLRPADTFARFGGDEFAILLEDVEEADATEVARRIAQELRAPFMVNGHELVVTASTGIVMDDSGVAGEGKAGDLLRKADVAMYRSKHSGKNRHEVFLPEMNHGLERLELEQELRNAIGRELQVHYQPTVLLGTGQITGFEALVRWEHPRLGLLDPGEFIPLAEDTGLILSLGRWVLWEACRQACEFQQSLRENLPANCSAGAHPVVFANLSPLQFSDPALIEEVAAVLREPGLAPCDLALEITESMLMEEDESATDTLHALKELGVKLVVDDFGTGYSPLTSLKSLPVDMLKVDRSMVADVDEQSDNLAIVSATTSLAHALGLTVVAEGVERAGELEKLRSLGCDYAQGYYWSEPRPAWEAKRLITDDKSVRNTGPGS